MHRKVAGVALVSLTLLGWAGCGGSAQSPPDRETRAVARTEQDKFTYARGLFREICAGCHTLADARANGRRYNLDRVVGLNVPEIWAAVRHGAPGMPPWEGVLTRREIQALVLYLLEVTEKSGREYDWERQIVRREYGESPSWRRISSRIYEITGVKEDRHSWSGLGSPP